MVRFNLVAPKILTDEHLNAENVELQMLQTFIDKYPTGTIPVKYVLGKGHMSFFRNKPNMLLDRIQEVKREQKARHGINIIFSEKYLSEYIPTEDDINLNKSRITDRLRNPIKKKTPWHYYGEAILDINKFIKEKYGEYK